VSRLARKFASPWLALAGLSLVVGCSQPASILVEVDAPDLPAGALDQLRFQVDGPAGSMADTTVALPPSWPQTLAVLPGAAGDRAEVTIRVTGLNAGTARIRRVVSASFSSGRQVSVRVTLSLACLDHVCADPFTDCLGGSCADSMDGGVDASMDAGMDATADATMDAGMDATTDATMDSGMDATTDAAMDAATDSGMDTGTACDGSGIEVCNGADDDCDGVIDDGLPCPGFVVISEMTTGTTTSLTQEFLELYNRMDFPISLSGVTIDYLSAASSTWNTRVMYGPTDVIPARGFFLAASANYLGTVSPDATTRWTVGFNQAGGHVRIEYLGTSELDRFGWGTAAMPEGTVFPNSSDGPGSYERKANAASTALSMESGADVTAGNGYDTDDNANDFVRRGVADPQNTSSAPETP